MAFEIEDASVVTRGEGWLSAWVGDEHVMMSAETGTCISLSETGGRIWELIEQPVTFNQLCDVLAAEYEVDGADLRKEAAAFLNALQQQKAIAVTQA